MKEENADLTTDERIEADKQRKAEVVEKDPIVVAATTAADGSLVSPCWRW